MSPGQLSFPVIACVRNSVVCRSHELAVDRKHALCMELKHAVRTHRLNWTPSVQFERDHLLLVPQVPSEVLQWQKQSQHNQTGGADLPDFKVVVAPSTYIRRTYVCL